MERSMKPQPSPTGEEVRLGVKGSSLKVGKKDAERIHKTRMYSQAP